MGGMTMAPNDQKRSGQPGGTVQGFFQNDHIEIDALFTALRRNIKVCAELGKPGDSGILSQFEEFDRRLEKHIHWEEELLFPAVEGTSPDLREGPGEAMRHEHQDIRQFKDAARTELKRAMQAPLALSKAAEALDQMRDILEMHNQKEERVYYPMADELLSPTQATDLLRRVQTT
jgi:regulator of cell morphogenesis and NO signaling